MAPKHNLLHVAKDYPFMTCLVKVHAGSSWQKRLRKLLKECHGVYNFRMDNNGVVEISGTIDPALLLKMLGKAGSKAQLQWFQFGECSSNLFMPQDGNRILQAGNHSRPKPPSHESAHCPKQIAYDHTHDYHPYARHNHYYQPYNYQQTYAHGHPYDQRPDYQNYDYTNDGRQQYGYDYQYNYDGNQINYYPFIPARAGEDIKCCRVM